MSKKHLFKVNILTFVLKELLAMTGLQPIQIFLTHSIKLWELACRRWRFHSRREFP